MSLVATRPPFLDGAVELAYVTSDIERACEHFRDRMKIRSFLSITEGRVDVCGQAEPAIMHAALAWAGNSLIEIIEPVRGPVGIFRDHLAGSGFRMRFHHVGVLVSSEGGAWEQLLAQLQAQQQSIALEASFGGSGKVIFADHLADLGHFVEYIRCVPEVEALFAQVPRSA